MNSQKPSPDSKPLKVAFAMAIFTGILALLNLILGWGAGLDFFIRIHPSFPAMVPTTAVCLLLGSLGLIAIHQDQSRWIARGCGLFIATLVIANYRLPHFDLGRDGMSIGTALACTLIAVCLVFKTLPDLPFVGRLFPKTLGLSVVMIPTIGFMFNADALFNNAIYTQMALHTAIGLAALFIGFLLLDSQSGWMKVLISPDLGSQMLRNLLPFIILVPISLTGLALIASHMDYLSPDLRASFLAYSMILLLMSAAIYFAHITNQAEQRAAQAEKLQRESDRARQAAEIALERGQKIEALGKLVGGVAHDFNNTLSVVLGNLQLLQVDPDTEAHPGYLSDSVEAVQHASHLTRQLLSYGRKSRLEPVPSVLDELIEKTLTMFQRLCPANISVTTQLTTPDLIVQVDQVNFQQALLNILINAKDAQPNGGAIIVSSSAQELGNELVAGFGGPEHLFSGTFVSVNVGDSGPGMTAQELSRATEPFFTTKPVGEGSGLGLSVASGFCRQSGGGMTLSSDLGQGLNVTMYFPVSPDGPMRVVGEEQQIQHSESLKHRILLVDDDPKVTRVMARQLQLDGNEVSVALNAAQALTIIERGPAPDLVITDLVMPGNMQGHALAKEIRTRFPRTHVVLMSGYDSIRQRQTDSPEWNEPFLL